MFTKILTKTWPPVLTLNKNLPDPHKPSFIIPIKNKKHQFVVSLSNQVAIISWDGQSDNYKTLETIAVTEDIDKVFNDGKCDSTGRLWAGIIKTRKLGRKFSVVNRCPFLGRL